MMNISETKYLFFSYWSVPFLWKQEHLWKILPFVILTTDHKCIGGPTMSMIRPLPAAILRNLIWKYQYWHHDDEYTLELYKKLPGRNCVLEFCGEKILSY